jgi:hypothetical protein
LLGKHRGDITAEMRRIVEILDVGTIHPEDMLNPHASKVIDDMIDHPVRTHPPAVSLNR